MNKQTCYYSLLYYRPSYITGEQLAIGVLYWFPSERKAVFDYPNHLQRLTSLYEDADLQYLRRYLQRYETIANQIARDGMYLDNRQPQEILEAHYGKEDSVNLVFESFKLALYSEISPFVKHQHTIFFQSYYKDERLEGKQDDSFLSKSFHLQLQERSLSSSVLRDHTIKGKRSEIVFDSAWKNGRLNLVQPLSFDYKQSQTIFNKAYTWSGRLMEIRDQLSEHEYGLHFLVAKPKQQDFLSSYRDAIEIVRDSVGNYTDKLNFYDNIIEYVEELSKNIHP